jgi:Zn-dependent protease with chaperone function
LSLVSLYGPYFTYLPTVLAIILFLFSIAAAYLTFSRSQSARTRSWSLEVTLVSAVFMWLFISASLILCVALAGSYQSELAEGVSEVFGDAILIAVLGGLPLTLVLRQAAPRIILRKVKDMHQPPAEVLLSFDTLSEKMGVPSSRLRLTSGGAPACFAVDTESPTVVMSEQLLTLLDKDELEAVLAHELAHIKNSDTALKALMTAYRTALPMDPIIRLVESAFHKVRESVADETAARFTKKPLSLATALLKIHDGFPGSDLTSLGAYSILSRTSSPGRHPPIKERIEHLIQLEKHEQP